MDLVGRDEELTSAVGRFADGRRLVTIVGPGGIGKTALARVVLAGLDGGPSNPMMVDLTRIERAAGVRESIAAQLGFPSFEAFIASPAVDGAVVLIDNCEHVIDAASEAIAHLLEGSDGVSVLATSRSPLELPGESLVALAPLEVPAQGAADAACDSVRLFRERARDAGVDVLDTDLDLVSELCRRLDGVPLAIELAAARLRSAGLGELVDRLNHGVETLERLGGRGSPRHRSVRDTIQWSIELLADEDRAALTWLGSCPGWFAADLAGALAGVTSEACLGVIERLVEASLLVVDRQTTPTRFRVLEPIRAVLLAELRQRGDLDTARDRLASHLVVQVQARLEASRSRLDARGAATAIDRFDQIDIALRHCLAMDVLPGRARLLYAILWGIVQQARLGEVVELGELLSARWPDPAGPHGADAASVFATARLFAGDLAGARSIALAALAHENESVFAAVTLRRVLGHAARFEGDHREAARWLGEAATAGFACNVPTLAIGSLAYQAQDVAALGDTEAALTLVRRAVTLAEEIDSPLSALFTRTVEASILAGLGPAERVAAVALAGSNLERATSQRYPFAMLGNLQTIAACHLADGRLGDAARAAGAMLQAVSSAGPGDLRRALDIVAAILAAAGDHDAVHLSATAATLPDTSPMIVGIALPVAGSGAVLDRGAAIRMATQRVAALASAVPAPNDDDVAHDGDEAVFARVGELWRLTFGGLTSSVVSSKGMDDLAALLTRPGRDIHCVELAGAAVEQPDTGEVIDAEARRRYEDRIRELQIDIDEAERDHDHRRAERAQAEFDALVEHLTAALGLAGKTRTVGGTVERARSAVTHRIRSAIRRIGAANPPLGRHLEASITTGTYCSYHPENPPQWRVVVDP